MTSSRNEAAASHSSVDTPLVRMVREVEAELVARAETAEARAEKAEARAEKAEAQAEKAEARAEKAEAQAASKEMMTSVRPTLTPQEKLSFMNDSLNRRASARKHRTDIFALYLKEEGDKEAAEEAEFRSHVQNQPEDVVVDRGDRFNANQNSYG